MTILIFVSIVLLFVYVESYVQRSHSVSFRYSTSYNLKGTDKLVSYATTPSGRGNQDDSNLDVLDLIETQQELSSLDLHLERTDQNKPQKLLSKDWEWPNAIKDIRCYLSVNESFVPVIGVHKRSTFIKLRSYLFGLGVYPGVEYRILDINVLDKKSNISRSISNDIRRNLGNSKVKSLQGLLQRARGDVGTGDDSTGWIGRLFNGQTSLIQTSGSDSSVIINNAENPSVELATYFAEEVF